MCLIGTVVAGPRGGVLACHGVDMAAWTWRDQTRASNGTRHGHSGVMTVGAVAELFASGGASRAPGSGAGESASLSSMSMPSSSGCETPILNLNFFAVPLIASLSAVTILGDTRVFVSTTLVSLVAGLNLTSVASLFSLAIVVIFGWSFATR